VRASPPSESVTEPVLDAAAVGVLPALAVGVRVEVAPLPADGFGAAVVAGLFLV
jgi:hypothetical protein